MYFFADVVFDGKSIALEMGFADLKKSLQVVNKGLDHIAVVVAHSCHIYKCVDRDGHSTSPDLFEW